MIVKATLDQLDEIMEAEALIFPKEPFSRRAYKYLIGKGWVYLIFAKEGLAGTGIILLNNLKNGKKKGRIYSVGVLDKFRGRGLASMLIKYMEIEMVGVEYITLETHKHHKNVIRLYEKLGYEIYEPLLKDYYTDGDGVRMKKYIYNHVPDISLKIIPQNKMRYPDLGDWFDSKNVWEIRVPELWDIDIEFSLLVHEIIERYLIMKQGYSVSYIDNWIKENLKDDYKQGAMTKGAPQKKAHIFATKIEKMICAHLGVNWRKSQRRQDKYLKELYSK
jgi:ribosomal protein S18 acetylase RimI-like enzyme